MVIAEHQLIFIHIPKCGGRSIAKAFGQEFTHQTVHAFDAPEYADFVRFAVIRNTWDRMVSIFHHVHSEPLHAGKPIQGADGVKTPFASWLRTNLEAHRVNFGTGDYQGCRHTHHELGSPFWFSSQLMWIARADAGLCVDWVLDFADFEEQFAVFCAGRGIDISLPHENRSAGRAPYPEYYDESLRELVRAHYAEEIEFFQFEF